MYGKYFESTYTGSMFGCGLYRHAVWGYVIANTKKDHTVELNPQLVAATIGCDVEGIIEAIEFLCSPDESSRSKEQDGRRITRQGQFIYYVVNHEKYCGLRNEEERREYNRLAQAKHRQSVSSDVNALCQHCQPPSAHVTVTTDINTKDLSEQKPPTRKSARQKKEPSPDARAVLDAYCLGFKERTDSSPTISWAKDMTLAKNLLSGRTVEQACAIAYEFGVRPPEWYLDRGAVGFGSCLAAANTIISRLADGESYNPGAFGKLPQVPL